MKNEFNRWVPFRFRGVLWVQVRVSGVRILCRVWISGRFGRFDTEPGLPTPISILPLGTISRLLRATSSTFLSSLSGIFSKFEGYSVFHIPFGFLCVNLRFASVRPGKAFRASFRTKSKILKGTVSWHTKVRKIKHPIYLSFAQNPNVYSEMW